MSAPFAPGEDIICVDCRVSPTSDGMHAELPAEGCVYRVLDAGRKGVLAPDGCVYNADWARVAGVNPAPFIGHHHKMFRKLRPNEAKAREAWRELLKALPQPQLDPARHSPELAQTLSRAPTSPGAHPEPAPRDASPALARGAVFPEPLPAQASLGAPVAHRAPFLPGED